MIEESTWKPQSHFKEIAGGKLDDQKNWIDLNVSDIAEEHFLRTKYC